MPYPLAIAQKRTASDSKEPQAVLKKNAARFSIRTDGLSYKKVGNGI